MADRFAGALRPILPSKSTVNLLLEYFSTKGVSGTLDSEGRARQYPDKPPTGTTGMPSLRPQAYRGLAPTTRAHRVCAENGSRYVVEKWLAGDRT